MEPNMTAFTKMIKRKKIWIFFLYCSMKGDGVDRMFLFAKRDISEWGSRCDQKITNLGSYKVFRQLPCLLNIQK